MQWKCLPMPRAGDGTAVIHYTTIYKVFAKPVFAVIGHTWPAAADLNR
jgi:hypothetical protein